MYMAATGPCGATSAYVGVAHTCHAGRVTRGLEGWNRAHGEHANKQRSHLEVNEAGG